MKGVGFVLADLAAQEQLRSSSRRARHGEARCLVDTPPQGVPDAWGDPTHTRCVLVDGHPGHHVGDDGANGLVRWPDQHWIGG